MSYFCIQIENIIMVIQRIQSVYLLLASIFMGLFSFLPTVTFGTFKLSPLSLENYGLSEEAAMSTVVESNVASYTWLYFLIGIVISMLILITIFLYKKLKRQKTFATFSLFLALCYYISVGIYSYLVMNKLNVADWNFTVYSFMPIIAIIFITLAIRGINKDRKLLSDSFRIR